MKGSERDGSHSLPSNAERMSVASLSVSVSINCDSRNTDVPRVDMCSVKRMDENNIYIYIYIYICTDFSVKFESNLFDHSLRYCSCKNLYKNLSFGY